MGIESIPQLVPIMRERMRVMLARVVLATVTLLLALDFGAGRAQDYLLRHPPPSQIARAQDLGDPREPILPPPRILKEDPLPPPRILEVEPPPVFSESLEASYEGIGPAFPNRFGSNSSNRIWGYLDFRIMDGDKIGPNGLEYNPCFSFDFNFNFAITGDRSLYAFLDSRFWASKSEWNIFRSNSEVGARQIDFYPGLAWNFWDRFEGRLYGYSFNNLNRGAPRPSLEGMRDGVAIEGRYYFAGTEFDQAIYNYLSVGYYMSNDMVDNLGNLWEPSAYLRWSYNVPLFEQRFYFYTIGELIAQRNPTGAKWLWLDTGISFRPIPHLPLLDFRFGNEANIDIDNNKSLLMWYVGARFAF